MFPSWIVTKVRSIIWLYVEFEYAKRKKEKTGVLHLGGYKELTSSPNIIHTHRYSLSGDYQTITGIEQHMSVNINLDSLCK
jgi:hypothetical protein